jgi:CBS-domain-containing membrane protein
MMVLGSSQLHDTGWQWAVYIVAINTGISLLLALLINNAIPGRHYPVLVALPAHPKVEPIIAPEQGDIEWALEQMDSVIDVTIEDLTEIYAMAAEHARTRYEKAFK